MLRSIAKKIDTNSIEKDEFIDNHLDGVKITWQDGEDAENRDIEFFPQNHMYEIAKDPKLTDKLIEKIIKEKDHEKILISYETFTENNRTEIINKINTLFKLQTQIDKLKVELKEKGDKEGIEKEIKVLENKIKTIISSHSLNDSELKEFEDISETISKSEQKIKLCENDIIQIQKLKEGDFFNSSFEYEFNPLSDLTRNTIKDYFQLLKEEALNNWRKKLEEEEKNLNNQKEQLIEAIRTEKKKDIYIKGIAYIDSNKQYKELQEKLTEEKKKYTSILNLEKKLEIQNEQKKSLKTSIVNLHKKYFDKAKELVESLKLEHSGIEIQPKFILKKDELFAFLSERLNLRGNERQNFLNDFLNNYQNNIEEKISRFIQDALDKKIDYKGIYADKTQPTVVSELVSTNWFDISYDLIYQNDRFKDMSQGKQAFVILKLLLEFSDKKCPILIDQPEDSLDNRAIYKELVQYLKDKKKERQIIIVTHNPNVVVSADAEQIIVANQNGKDSKNNDSNKFQYVTGSLEFTNEKDDSNEIILKSQGIREHVCEILEGGNEAFKNRERKYSINIINTEK